MKKLKLKLDGVKEMLTKEQMRKISGGYGIGVPSYCSISCGPNQYACCQSTFGATCTCVGNGYDPIYGGPCGGGGSGSSWCSVSVPG